MLNNNCVSFSSQLCCITAGTAAAIVTMLVLIIRFSLETFWLAAKPWDAIYIQNFVQYFIIGITVLVVAVPEGLPLAVTISLAFSVRVSAHPHSSILLRV
jgi:Ca2+ transporting ATPase